jgi:hypothetical protein
VRREDIGPEFAAEIYVQTMRLELRRQIDRFILYVILADDAVKAAFELNESHLPSLRNDLLALRAVSGPCRRASADQKQSRDNKQS